MLKGGKHILKLFMQISFCCSGLDLLAYEPQSHAFHLVESKKFNVSWYLYTHESRLILLASGMQCTMFTGYQVMAPAWDKIIEAPSKDFIFPVPRQNPSHARWCCGCPAYKANPQLRNFQLLCEQMDLFFQLAIFLSE